eukprot:scaffold75313_cov36-Phaeocystis_antarctica.AAC.1
MAAAQAQAAQVLAGADGSTEAATSRAGRAAAPPGTASAKARLSFSRPLTDAAPTETVAAAPAPAPAAGVHAADAPSPAKPLSRAAAPAAAPPQPPLQELHAAYESADAGLEDALAGALASLHRGDERATGARGEAGA